MDKVEKRVKREMLRVGLVGLGEIHVAHVRGYESCRDLAEIVAVCDRDEARAQQWAKEYGAAAFFDVHEMLASAQLDAIDVMVPHSLHEEAVAAGLRAGCHVLVEKPLAPTLEAVARLAQLAKESGRTLALAENTRFVRAYQEVERLHSGGAFGGIELVRTMICGSEVSRLRQRELWKGRKDGTVGGVILDAGVHSFYLMRWLFGGVTEVGAWTNKRIAESEVEDNGIVFGHLQNGADFFSEFVFTAEIPWSERLEIYGSKGSCIVDQLSDPVVRYFKDNLSFEGQKVQSVEYCPGDWKYTSITAEVKAFIESLSGGPAYPITLADAVHVARVSDAAYSALGDGPRLRRVGG